MPVKMETPKMETTGPEVVDTPKGICKLCLKNQTKYTCPRCNIQYCSTDCYKCDAHMQCSEKFYRDCFMDGLQDLRSSDEDKRKVTEMLKRLETQSGELDSDDNEADDAEELAERLDGVNLDNTDELWGKLTDQERTEFRVMLDDGRLGNLIELWQPWWTEKDTHLVEDLDKPRPVRTTVPEIVKDISPIDTMLKNKPPAPSMPYTVVNVLYGYAYVCRLYNGGHHQTPGDAAKVLLEVSEALGARSYDSTGDAIHACMNCIQNRAAGSGKDFQVAVVSDVKLLLEGRARSPVLFVMAALSDIHRLLGKAKKSTMSKGGASGGGVAPSVSRLRKKVEFLVSWCHKYGLCLSSCLTELELEICTLTSELARHGSDKDKLEQAWGGTRPPKPMRRFVEEIS